MTPSRFRCRRKAASGGSCVARCFRTPRDAWYVPKSVKTGYEISFNRYFYQPEPMRTLEEIRAEIAAVEREAEGLLDGVVWGE